VPDKVRQKGPTPLKVRQQRNKIRAVARSFDTSLQANKTVVRKAELVDKFLDYGPEKDGR